MIYSVKMRRKFGPLKLNHLLKSAMTVWLVFGLFSLHVAPEFLHNLLHVLEQTQHTASANPPSSEKDATFQIDHETCKFQSLLASHLNNHTLIAPNADSFEFPITSLFSRYKFKSVSIPFRFYKQNSARAPPVV